MGSWTAFPACEEDDFEVFEVISSSEEEGLGRASDWAWGQNELMVESPGEKDLKGLS